MTTIPSLRQAVEDRHCCFATLRQVVRVVDQSENKAAVDVTVVVFNLIGSPFAEIAYAWYDPSSAPEGPRLHTVLHTGAVDSAERAVRAVAGGGRASERAS